MVPKDPSLNRVTSVHLSKTMGRLSSTSPEILAFVSHCLANFQLILDCSIPKFKLKHENSENIIADSVTIVVFNLHQIKRLALSFGHRYIFSYLI